MNCSFAMSTKKTEPWTKMKVLLIITVTVTLLSCLTRERRVFELNPHAIKVSVGQDSVIRNEFVKTYGQKSFYDSIKYNTNKIDCEVYFKHDYEIELCEINDQKFTPDDISAFLRISKGTLDYRDTLNLESKVYNTDGKISIDIYNEVAYLAWISGNSEKRIPSELHFKSINLKTGKPELEKILHSQKWGIDRLSLIFNPFTSSILISYNDLSKSDNQYLYLGDIAVKNLSKPNTELAPISILNHDGSEKRSPGFIRTSKAVYLYHTSGDTWGLMAHRGQQGIGISLIDKDNSPSGYKTLSDKNTINEEILIINDTVYYQHVTGKNHGDFELKQIALSDLHEFN
jgi:hypothetical protein